MTALGGMKSNYSASLRGDGRDTGMMAAAGAPNSETMVAALGKASVIAGGTFIFIAAFLEVVAIFGPWWTDAHSHNVGPHIVVAEVRASLWNVRIESPQSLFGGGSVSWETYCGPDYVNDASWCDKIRAVRATTILAAALCIWALVPLGLQVFLKLKWSGEASVALMFLSMISAVCAFSTSLFYPVATDPSVDTPGFAFIMMCMGALFSCIGICMSSYGMFHNVESSASFQKLDSCDAKKVAVKKDVSAIVPPATAYGSEGSCPGSPTYASQDSQNNMGSGENNDGQYVSERV